MTCFLSRGIHAITLGIQDEKILLNAGIVVHHPTGLAIGAGFTCQLSPALEYRITVIRGRSDTLSGPAKRTEAVPPCKRLSLQDIQSLGGQGHQDTSLAVG